VAGGGGGNQLAWLAALCGVKRKIPVQAS